MVLRSATKEQIEASPRTPPLSRKLEGKTVVKTIVVPGRLVNFVAK